MLEHQEVVAGRLLHPSSCGDIAPRSNRSSIRRFIEVLHHRAAGVQALARILHLPGQVILRNDVQRLGLQAGAMSWVTSTTLRSGFWRCRVRPSGIDGHSSGLSGERLGGVHTVRSRRRAMTLNFPLWGRSVG